MTPLPRSTVPLPPPPHVPTVPTAPAAEPGTRLSAAGRTGRIAGLGAMVAATSTVALAEPGRVPLFLACPSRVLLGLDCPACGGLRGTHDLLGGRIGDALDHNLLLPGLLLAVAAGLALWLVPLTGRPAPTWRPPRWVTGTAIAVVAAFTVARNLPIDALTFLASD